MIANMLSEGNGIDLMYRARRRLSPRTREHMGLFVEFASLKSFKVILYFLLLREI
jgi:hypothetical protein